MSKQELEVSVAVRLPPNLVAALDELIKHRQITAPWQSTNRGDLIREALFKMITTEFIAVLPPPRPLKAYFASNNKKDPFEVISLGYRRDGSVIPFIFLEVNGIRGVHPAEVYSAKLGGEPWTLLDA